MAKTMNDERWASRGGDPRFSVGRSGRYAAPVDALVLDVFDLECPSTCGRVALGTISIVDGGPTAQHRPAFQGRLLAFR